MSNAGSSDASHVRLLRVFVSSPGDVVAERDALDKVVHREWVKRECGGVDLLGLQDQ